MKLRLHSTKEENEKFIQLLRNTTDIDILSQSTPYADRGKSKYERVYLDVAVKEKDIFDNLIKETNKILNSTDKQLIKDLIHIFKLDIQAKFIQDELYLSFCDVMDLLSKIEGYL